MNWTRRILAALLLSVAITAGLTLLPHLDNAQQGGLQPAFLNKGEDLTDRNIVDFMTKMQMHMRIRKVELNRSIVSIDLSANAGVAKTDALQDLYELPQYIFAHTTNINQIFVRVLDTNQDPAKSAGGSLVAALDAKRDSWMPDTPRMAPVSADELSQYIQSHYHVTFTAKWDQRFKAAE